MRKQCKIARSKVWPVRSWFKRFDDIKQSLFNVPLSCDCFYVINMKRYTIPLDLKNIALNTVHNHFHSSQFYFDIFSVNHCNTDISRQLPWFLHTVSLLSKLFSISQHHFTRPIFWIAVKICDIYIQQNIVTYRCCVLIEWIYTSFKPKVS